MKNAATDRDETIKAIRAALKTRSRRSWSVKGGRGTAWGWIRINTMPSRGVCHACSEGPRSAECSCSVARPYMDYSSRTQLAALLGLDRPVHCQGESIPAGSDYYREYIDRAHGRTPSVTGTPYWD